MVGGCLGGGVGTRFTLGSRISRLLDSAQCPEVLVSLVPVLGLQTVKTELSVVPKADPERRLQGEPREGAGPTARTTLSLALPQREVSP